MNKEQLTDLINSNLITGGEIEVNDYLNDKPKWTLSFTKAKIESETIIFSKNSETVYTIKLNDILETEQVEPEAFAEGLLFAVCNAETAEHDVMMSFDMSDGNAFTSDDTMIEQYKHTYNNLKNELGLFRGKAAILKFINNGEMFNYYIPDEGGSYSKNCIEISIKELEYKITIKRNVPCVVFTDTKNSDIQICANGICYFHECNEGMTPNPELKIYHIGTDGGYFALQHKGYVYPNMKA